MIEENFQPVSDDYTLARRPATSTADGFTYTGRPVAASGPGDGFTYTSRAGQAGELGDAADPGFSYVPPFPLRHPAPAPPPPPVPTCVTPTLFADCFESCVGTINGASPGPICGWIFIEPFGPVGGEFNFTPGVMSMDTFDADDFPVASKSLPASLPSVFGLSGQFDFTEYSSPPNATTAYLLTANNLDLSESLSIALFGDGTIGVQAGDPASIPSYTGVWTPTPGADHVVHFAIDGAGVPTLYIDAAPVPLVFFGNIPSFLSAYPMNSVHYGGGAGDAAAGVSPVRNIFLTAGALGPETEFCCP